VAHLIEVRQIGVVPGAKIWTSITSPHAMGAERGRGKHGLSDALVPVASLPECALFVPVVRGFERVQDCFDRTAQQHMPDPAPMDWGSCDESSVSRCQAFLGALLVRWRDQRAGMPLLKPFSIMARRYADGRMLLISSARLVTLGIKRS
jgi:hypothetical protein